MDKLNTDIILLGGGPASGKSTKAQDYKYEGYSIFNRDRENCSMKELAKKVEKHLKSNKQIVVDATLPTKEVRQLFIDIAKENNLTIGFHHIATSKEDCLINSINRMRDISGEILMHPNDDPNFLKIYKGSNVWVLPAIFAYFKKFEKPMIIDGFDEIIKTKFERKWQDWYDKKAVFVDLDGTVRETISGDKYPISKDDVRILPNSVEKLREYKDNGYIIIGVTNQSGVNKGKFVKDSVEDIIEHTNHLMGGVIDTWKYCLHSVPKEICYCRKPQSGMGVYFIHAYGLNPEKCIMVGDMSIDRTFAQRLGFKYYDAKEFFDR